VATSPVVQAEVPAPKPPDPQPPTPAEAAKLIEEASADPDWGALVWFTMTTGARRGEVCALRWRNVDLDGRTVQIRRAIATDGRRNLVETDTKTHQQRRVALDEETTAVLGEHKARPRRPPHFLGAS
jgi:integrase